MDWRAGREAAARPHAHLRHCADGIVRLGFPSNQIVCSGAE